MATSESDDFESADEELDNRSASKKRGIVSKRSPAFVDSDSDDGTASPIQPQTYRNSCAPYRGLRDSQSPTSYPTNNQSSDSPMTSRRSSLGSSVPENEENLEPQAPIQKPTKNRADELTPMDKTSDCIIKTESCDASTRVPDIKSELEAAEQAAHGGAAAPIPSGDFDTKKLVVQSVAKSKKERPQRQQKPKETKSLGARKLGAKIESTNVTTYKQPSQIEPCWEELDSILSKPMLNLELGKNSGSDAPKWDSAWDSQQMPVDVEECWEGMDDDIEIPEELRSNKKFKEVFKSDGWENMDQDIEILEEKTEENILPVLDKLSKLGEEPEKSGTWGWGGWGVSTLINSASAGVTTLTNHMSQGLTMLEESIGAPDPVDLAEDDKREAGKPDVVSEETTTEDLPDMQSQTSFGFGNLMSGVSSITKLVESTSNKVIAGGLDTLETIGKKTMEVLQDGDPGLKKKRAFFTNEKNKPILSQILREAKDKADTEEKTLEEKQLARKVHFESLFDDYQGLVHLEALEMLSKQCDLKIQQHMINLNADELCSMQETLEEVKELCDLGDEEEDDERDSDLQKRLKGACKDLGVNMSYDKLLETWEQTRLYLSTVVSTESLPADRDIFQRAISTLAQFTALSVERFHKTAELLLVKERRSTVNEADALVQFTNILSGEVGVLANLFADKLNERVKHSVKPDAISANITTIFLEAANASSYIQDAFKLLIPVLQVGAT